LCDCPADVTTPSPRRELPCADDVERESTATASASVTNSQWGIYIVDQTTGQQQNCSTGKTSVLTVGPFVGTTHTFIAKIGLFAGTSTQAPATTGLPLTIGFSYVNAQSITSLANLTNSQTVFGLPASTGSPSPGGRTQPMASWGRVPRATPCTVSSATPPASRSRSWAFGLYAALATGEFLRIASAFVVVQGVAGILQRATRRPI
jgi:hypothetical protein